MKEQLQIAKDTVAKQYGYETFEQFDDKSTFGYDHRTPEIIDKIAILYNKLLYDTTTQVINNQHETIKK